MGRLSIITKITQQKRSSNRFNVFLDEEYAFSISEDVYIKFHLYKGKEMTAAEIDVIKQADDVQRAYLLAVHYLSYRMRTEQEMRTHLREKDLLNDVIENVIARLYEEGLLNDKSFAMAFINDRMNRSTKGPNVVRRELMEKGITKHIIDETLTVYTKEEQINKAYTLGEKEAKKSSRHPLKRRKNQLKSRLLRRGFTKDVVFEVVEMVEFDVDEENEFLLLKKEADKLYTKYKNKYEHYELTMRLKQRLYSRGFPLSQIDSYITTLANED